jgi:Tfp pilus assembly protein PilN
MNLVKDKPPIPPSPDKKSDFPAPAKPDSHHYQPAPKHDLPSTSQPPLKPVQPGEIVFSQVKGEPDDHKKNKEEEELDVNLLPKRQRKLTDKQIIISYVMIFIIGVLAVVSPYIFYRTNNSRYQAENILLEEQIELIAQSSQAIQAQIKELGPLSNKLKQLLTLFDQHVYWSEFFPSLERHTAKNVYFTSLDVGADNHIALQGKALTLRDIAEQLIILQTSQDYFNVQLQNLTLVETEEPDEPQIEFSLDFNLDPSIILIDNSQDSD